METPRRAGRIDCLEIEAKSVLNRVRGMPFGWSINPYRGCYHQCVFCYARRTHTFLERDGLADWGTQLSVKINAPAVLRRELANPRWKGEHVAIGTATDPYQPAERKFGLTRSILEVFARLGGLDLSITTKSALIERDLDLLREINSRSRLSVNFSLITINRRLQRILEPRAPRPALRLRALAQLTAAGIHCNVLMMPMIPGLTDGPAAIESVIRAARRSGAAGVWWRSLFLKPAAARRFVPFIRENFPEHAARIDDFYGHSTYAPRTYDDHLRTIFDRLKRKYGYNTDTAHGEERMSGKTVAQPSKPRQLDLMGSR